MHNKSYLTYKQIFVDRFRFENVIKNKTHIIKFFLKIIMFWN